MERDTITRLAKIFGVPEKDLSLEQLVDIERALSHYYLLKLKKAMPTHDGWGPGRDPNLKPLASVGPKSPGELHEYEKEK